MLFNKMLVVLEPNKTKQYALDRAVALAREQKNPQPVEITVFMSVYDIAYEMSELLSSEEDKRKMRDSIIAKRSEEIQPILAQYHDPDIQFKTLVVWNSNEADAITEAVDKEHFKLVVKYTVAKDEGLSALLFTPQDWQLLRKCPAPIMMVRNTNWQHKRRILIAVNVGDDDATHVTFNDELVQLGMTIANNLERGNVHLVSAYPPSAINVTIDMPEFQNKATEKSERQSHEENMKVLCEKFGIASDHAHVIEGFPEEVIPEVAKQIEAEMVVLGTVGRRGLAAAFLGNTAEHVISRLHCNLLTIKPSID
ncbi:universal stress protein UspE [Actinobacillus delphinicola]|uniref:Universal stress protein UspE n=1 Tax=Actinobacillus delphinicola TaxID=51161 RepID=A0A448TWB4_9PAST|nr:universal stress protein UspE [Actinobacillus delphinicola]MDG6896787.1 universal stress protein UspE [Actinobacillus delphinicola]VEJ10221.1 universal stress protein UspE [Actinobacillus delphinicola]